MIDLHLLSRGLSVASGSIIQGFITKLIVDVILNFVNVAIQNNNYS